MKLFMVYLGGTAPKANIELHDIQFVVGNAIEDTFEQLRKKWFGSLEGLHIDSYKEIKGADGFAIEFKDQPQNSANRLYFVNLGGYQKDQLPEVHAFGLFVAESKDQAKKKAMKSLLKNVEQKHKDELFEVEDCIQLDQVDGYYIHLNPTNQVFDLSPDWFGYHVISKK